MLARLHVLTFGAALAVATLASVPRPWTMDLAPQRLGPYGSASGSEYTLACGRNRVMTGFQGTRSDSAITSIGPLCRSVDANGQLSTKASGAEVLTGTTSGSPITGGAIAGTADGSPTVSHCPTGSVAAGIMVYKTTLHLVGIELVCRAWIPSARRVDVVTARVPFGAVTPALGVSGASGICGSDRQPIVGIFGRSKEIVRSLGATCDEP